MKYIPDSLLAATFCLVSCMSLLVLAAAPASAAPCAALSHDLIGAWETQQGPFEQMEFTTQDDRQEFNSWLHERPEISGGNWTLSACALQIRSGRADSDSWQFQVLSLSATRLTLRERAGRKSIVYRRIP